MQNYPFYVLRERGRLTFVQEFERKDGAKKRMKEFRNQTKAKQKCRIRKLLHLEPNQKIYEDDLIDLQREYTEEIFQLKDQIRRLSTTLAHFEEVEDIQKGSIFQTAPSNSLIEKYVKTREPDFHLMELQQENEDLAIELDDLREAISQESINELQEEEYDNSKEIMRILGDCRYFQNLIDEFDSKLQHFKPNPQVQELKSKKAEIKQNLQEEINESNRLQELLASGKFLDDINDTEPRLDFEESVFPIRKAKHSIKKYLEAKKKEYEDLCASHQKEIDDINNNVRSPEFYVTLRTLDDLSEARKRTNERFQEQQLEQFQRLNLIRPPEIISSSSSKEEPKVPTIQIPTIQNKTIPPKKKKVVKQLGPPSFLTRQRNQQASNHQTAENQPQKPIKRVKQTSSHLFEPKKYSSAHQIPEQKPMQFYKKPPKSSQHDEKWKEELEEIRKEKELKQKVLDENDQSSQKSVHNNPNMEVASIDLTIEMNVTTEKNNPDQSDEEMELTKENDDNQAEQKVRNVTRDPVNAIDKTEEEMLNSLLSTALATLSNLTDNKNNQNEEPSNLEEKHHSHSNENIQDQSNGDTEEKLTSSIERRVDNDSKEKARDYSSDDKNSNTNEKADSDVEEKVSNDSSHEMNSLVDKKVSDYSSDDKNSDANEHTSNKSVEDANAKEESGTEMKENTNVLSSLITSGINSLVDTKVNNEPQSNESSIINHDSNQSQHNDESNDSLKDDFDSSSDNKAVDSPTKDDVNNQTVESDSTKHSVPNDTNIENNESNAPDESVTPNDVALNSSKESLEKSQTELNDTKDEESDASNKMRDSDSFDFFSAHSDDDANKATSEKDKSNNESENINGSSKEDLNSSSNTKSLVNTNQSPNKSSTSELKFESDSHVISNEMKSSEHQSGAEPQKLQGLVTNIIGSLMNQPNDSIDKGSTTHQAQSDDEIVSASLSEHNAQKSSSED